MLKRTARPFYTKGASRLTSMASAALKRGDRDGFKGLMAAADKQVENRKAQHAARDGRKRVRTAGGR